MHFFNENFLSIKSSPKFIPKGPINNISALVQMVAWRWPRDKQLSEQMMIILLTHIWSLSLNELTHILGFPMPEE